MIDSKFVIRLLGTQLLMMVVQTFLYFILFSILTQNQIYQWSVGIFFILLFWLVIYGEANQAGQNDLKRETFYLSKGFIAGLLASIPGVLLYIGSVVYKPIEVFLRLWLMPYAKLFISWDFAMPHLAIILILFFPLVTGLSYRDGIRRRNKILNAIEQKNALRAELSKRDS